MKREHDNPRTKPRQGRRRKKRQEPPPEEPWAEALDVQAFDKALARMIRALRQKRRLNLSRAGRRASLTRQGWRKVERKEASPTAHSEVLMCNALRLRPSLLMRMVEDWLELQRQRN